MRSRLLLLAVAWLLATAPAALAQGEMIIISGMRLKAHACPPSRTVAVSLEKLAAEPEAFHGKCVRLRGQAQGGDELSALPGPSSQGGPAAIGIYGGKTVLGQFRRAQLLTVEVVGQVGTCRSGIDYNGYCHYHDPGTFVILASVRRLGNSDNRPHLVTP